MALRHPCSASPRAVIGEAYPFTDVTLAADSGRELQVRGKGGCVRVIPVGGQLPELLEALPAGWAFPGNKGCHPSPDYVGSLLKTMLGDYSGHALRHRYGSRAYTGTRDYRPCRPRLGHSKPETTARYGNP